MTNIHRDPVFAELDRLIQSGLGDLNQPQITTAQRKAALRGEFVGARFQSAADRLAWKENIRTGLTAALAGPRGAAIREMRRLGGGKRTA